MNAHQRHVWRTAIAHIQDNLQSISLRLGDLRYGSIEEAHVDSEFNDIMDSLEHYVKQLQYLKENR